MLNQLLPSISKAVTPLFEEVPLSQAMPRLVEPSNTSDSPYAPLVRDIIDNTIIHEHPTLASALWLYVDELDLSHTISQNIDDATGSYWHGIMHRREGDFSNSHYWFRRAGLHPVMEIVDGGYSPDEFVDQVAAASAAGEPATELVELQRREWESLFVWCAGQQG